MPSAPPDRPGYDIAAVNLPTHAIGGDYYDYVPLGDGRLRLAVNCGHNPPLLLRGGGGREMLRRGGAALGLFAGERFQEGAVRLEPGDSLVLYTDGVVEPTDDRHVEFGAERLEAAVRGVADRSAADALRAVIKATQAFSGRDRYDDDFTLVVVRRDAAAR